MKLILISLLAASLLTGCTGLETSSQSNIFSVNLPSLDHQTFSLQQLAKNKASVIVFLQPECPFCNSYGKTLRKLDSAYSQKQIAFIGVVAGKNYPEDEIIEYIKKHQLKFTLLLDPDFNLKEKLRATVTPEAFLLDKNGMVLYRGMIDNWGYEIGKVRARVTEHYLTDAMDNYLQNKTITLDSTKAIGCYIE